MALLAPALAIAQEVPELQVNSERYIVLDAETGDIYAQRGADDEVAIASLTKVFTAVQALNMAPLDTQITTKESDLQSTEATTMGFGPGETYTLRDLLYGMMLPSGNDAAYAVARGLGYQDGDTDEEAVERFMTLLNHRVKNMGLENTHLINPDGWGVPGHYSSAADVAAFMQYAMEYPDLVEIMGTRSYTTSNGLLTVTNSNKLLNSYGSFIAGKTGYDDDAGWCLVVLAGSGDSRMIAVTLDGVAPDDWYDDNRVLLEYGFQRKSAIVSSGQPFNGDVVRYTDPDAAQLAESGQPEAAIANTGNAATNFQPPSSSGDIISTGRPAADMKLDHAGPWLAALAAIGLVGASGVLNWRDLGGMLVRRHREPVDLSPTDS
jgi:D-alanyl-D-alanine carboxypeptidase